MPKSEGPELVTDQNGLRLTIMPRTLIRRATDKHSVIRRFLMAAFGGIALLVPMIIMVCLDRRTTPSLIITSLLVLVFAGAIAWGSALGPMDVLSATAAYAAVLVVFVGTSGKT